MDLFKSNCCFDYKLTGIGVGVVGIALTIGFAAFFGPIFLILGDKIIVLVALSMLGMHFVINSFFFLIFDTLLFFLSYSCRMN